MKHAEGLDLTNVEERGIADQIQLALRVIQEEFTEDATIQSLLAKREITWPLLWALFPRNELVINQDELDQTRAYLAKYHDTFQDEKNDMLFALDVCFVDDNGEKMGLASKGFRALSIKEFPGSQKIAGLPFYPLRYATDCDEKRAELLERGRKRILIGASKLHDCSGHGMQTKYRFNGDQYIEPFQVSAEPGVG